LTRPGGTARLVTSRGTHAIAALAQAFASRRLAPLGTPAHAVALVCAEGEEAVAAAAALAATGLDGVIVPAERMGDAVRAVLEAGGCAVQMPGGALAPAPGSAAPAVPGRVRLLTSGTTGVPKLVPHTWESLFTLRRAGVVQPQRWLVTYQAGTYAWFQMVTMALFLAGQDLVLSDDESPAGLLAAAATLGATAISATPTFWRYAGLTATPESLAALAPKQLTLGGERIDAAVLEWLRAQFPNARLTHIYASSEVGAAIVVHDGREGFPAAWLVAADAPPSADAVQLRIEDGILWVRSPHASTALAGWVNTGDRVERRDDRVVIVGRESTAVINVGGMKIAPHAVEDVLLLHPAVAWCRVYARASALVGALVAADVVLRDPAAAGDAEGELARHAAARLPEYAVPRLFRFLGAIPMTGNRKSEVP